MISTFEVLLICVVALILFGSSKLPKFFRTLGEARKEFEKGQEVRND